ncbi:hypothetical protein JMG10_07730 [Nostoc ellipsosporum NOK]|nr:hypothetical protein [Nostoc ellipsosporum NOK]
MLTKQHKKDRYLQFLERKIIQTPATGFHVDLSELNPRLKKHQSIIVQWALEGGRRGIGASFGLGKTVMQLEIAWQVMEKTGMHFLIGMPLSVADEFAEDAEMLGYQVHYVEDMEAVNSIERTEDKPQIFMSNYERIRVGKFDPARFGGVSFDEGDAIRNLDTETTDYIMHNFSGVEYRFIATATPSPNDYTELLNYAQFLGVMDRGQALTRFFQRNSTTAGDLTLYPHKVKEFWYWVRSWMLIIQKPSDIGCSDVGYDLPPLHVRYHMVNVADRGALVDRDGKMMMFRDSSQGLVEASREKRDSLGARVGKAIEIVKNSPDDHFILWHHLDDEYKAIQRLLPEVKVIHGGQPYTEREQFASGFKNGLFKYLATKPRISGSGCNFQKHCHRAVFVGINYEFKDFIQAIHRILRFMQQHQVCIDIIYSDAEEHVLKTLLEKWVRHNEMQKTMSEIIREYGLSDATLVSELKRTIGVNRRVESGENWTAIHNDAVLEAIDMEDNSLGMILTSIPFSDQYEYCESYHDMGHNDGNGEFFEQLDFLTPELLRVLKPGRVACVHVKDRIQFSYQNGVGFTSLIDFSGQTVAHFIKHGWYLLGKHLIPTDVAAENAQTYRLGWTEQCKDATKMGSGSPEYLLVFRKPPTDKSNAYADEPVVKTKDEYTRARWQLDAHALWLTNGNRLLNPDELRKMNLSQVGSIWRQYCTTKPYDFEEHVRIAEALDSVRMLPAGFMAVPPRICSPSVWDDVSRMHTLNSSQTKKKQEKHVCPLQFDIVDRAINRYSNPGDTVYDPFGGIMTVPYRAQLLKDSQGRPAPRKGIATELNENYWCDGVRYCREAEVKRSVPTLFDSF